MNDHQLQNSTPPRRMAPDWLWTAIAASCWTCVPWPTAWLADMDGLGGDGDLVRPPLAASSPRHRFGRVRRGTRAGTPTRPALPHSSAQAG